MPDSGTPGSDRNAGRDEGLGRELRELGTRIEYPPTPDLAASVRERLEEEGPQSASWRSIPVWAVAAAVLAVFVVVPVISFAVFEPLDGTSESGGGQVAGSGGDAAQERAGGAASEEAPAEDMPSSAGPDSDLPSSAAGPSPPLGRGLNLGDRISLEDAQSRMGGLLLPAGQGPPDEVYATEGPTGNGVALVYGSREDFAARGGNPGFVLTELPGGAEEAFGSGAGSGDGAEEVAVGGTPAVWVSGPEASGAYRLTEGLGGSALFFARDGVALRLESNLARSEAIRLAESVE